MLISAVLAMIRGFVREVLSIASWVAAAVAAYLLYGEVLPFARQYISNEYVALGAAVAGVFLITLIIVSYITMRISDFVLDSRIGALDRTLGFVFGAARGLLLVVVAMLFFNWFVPAERQPQWVAGAKSRPVLVSIGDRLIAALPEDPEQAIMDRIRSGRAGAGAVTDDQDGEDTGYSPSERQGLDQLTRGGSGN
ncbi:Putative Colicin V production protein, cvpA-like (DedE protein) (Pur regulon 18 kDa protein) [Polymorphum gilvum SL003B-26A1]|uniref:Putative Colicin V production protein, cvpA-like (DedE protein) (Pur regulon 18 kDa protein) n=2 Tax=Polymorphum TaxID=991903 RepID=F2J1N7_POLGS|nr:Putative Colicin V production protein, cvpA-like (DedE protein) (Pur regulon 18 kDa protein) [Polymorphum gilvum SL003B-26A1]